MVRVVLVDDQELMRVGLRMVLDSQEDVEVVDEAEDGASAVDKAREHAPDVVLMDVRMPGMDGVRATELIVGEDLAKVLVMTTFDLDDYALSALRAGAGGFLLKDTPPDDLVSAVRSVHEGDAVVSPSVTKRLLDRFLGASGGELRDDSVLEVLTDREREVLVNTARGLSNSEIAERMFLSEATVKTHIGRVLSKLELRDRVQAVVLAYETGLVRPGGE